MSAKRWLPMLMCYLVGVGANADDLEKVRSQKIQAKLSEIGFVHNEKLAKIESEDGSVVCGLPDIMNCKMIGDGWKAIYSNITVHQHGDEICKEITYKKNDEVIRVVYYLVEREFEKIELRFIGFLSEGAGFGIPGERGPSNLGDISILLPRNNGKEVIFLKANFLARIASDNSNIDVCMLGKWIQDHLVWRKWSEYSKLVQKPIKEILGRNIVRQGQALLLPMSSPINGRINQPIEISIEMPAVNDSDEYIYKWVNDDSMFKCYWNNRYWTLVPIKTGIGVFKYIVIDKRTLLSHAYEIKIDTQP